MSDTKRPRIQFGTPRIPAPTPTSADDAGALNVDASIRSQPFPTMRSYRWMPVASVGTGLPDEALFVTQDVLTGVMALAAEDLDHEVGGFLLGNRFQCPESGRRYVMIDQYSPARFTEASSVSLAFTQEAWAHIGDELSGKYFGKLLVGWYHSHPRMDVFLSESDVPIHESRFKEPWMTALVVEPHKGLGGFFARRDGRLDDRLPVAFYEYLEGTSVGSGTTRMAWSGYVCEDPATNAAISPIRQEPERPVTAAAAPALAALSPTLSEPVVLPVPFPSARLIRWTPDGAPSGDRRSTALVVTQEVLTQATALVAVSLEREIGGFLLGNRYRCPNTNRDYVVIDQYSPAQYTESTNVSLSFTREAWGRLADELSGKFLGKMLLGWYHSHPRMGIFLSQWDVTLHNQRFPDEWMSALVIDPSRQAGGFFRRTLENLDPRTVVEFYELRDGGGPLGPAESAMPWVGYEGRIDSSDELVAAVVARPALPETRNGQSRETRARETQPSALAYSKAIRKDQRVRKVGRGSRTTAALLVSTGLVALIGVGTYLVVKNTTATSGVSVPSEASAAPMSTGTTPPPAAPSVPAPPMAPPTPVTPVTPSPPPTPDPAIKVSLPKIASVSGAWSQSHDLVLSVRLENASATPKRATVALWPEAKKPIKTWTIRYTASSKRGEGTVTIPARNINEAVKTWPPRGNIYASIAALDGTELPKGHRKTATIKSAPTTQPVAPPGSGELMRLHDDIDSDLNSIKECREENRNCENHVVIRLSGLLKKLESCGLHFKAYKVDCRYRDVANLYKVWDTERRDKALDSLLQQLGRIRNDLRTAAQGK